MELVVGVDMATAAVRVLAAGGDGAVYGWAEVPLAPPSRPQPGWSEQDAGSWWPAVAGALRRLTGQLGPTAGAIVALSVCATSGTVAVLDAAGQPAGPALLYDDQRAGGEAAAAGLPATSGLPKWARLAAHAGAGEPLRLCHAPDVLVSRLIGRPAPTDWSHALKSGYDPATGQWPAASLAALGIPESRLPDVLPPTEVAGTLCARAAAETGLPAGCAVRLGMTDGCAAQLAAGGASPGSAVSVLGTTLVLKTAGTTRVADASGAVYSHRHPGGWWLPGGASSTGGRAIAEAFAGRDLAALDAGAARHGPARAVTYPLPGRGERFPFAAPGAEGFWLGEPGSDIERYRAILEGVAFVERLGYERLAALGAAPAGRVMAAGNGSRSRPWNQIRAAVLGVPLVAVPQATTALGACILAAAGSLHPDLAAATGAMSASGPEVGPDEERGGSAMAASYERFRVALTDRGWL
jgi:sugar (pentulose or hexulose) kinase